jgi:pimeloyl-ACP methyl ester carboxylesterase
MNKTDRTNKQIKLKDGRMLAYAEYGAPDGKPVVYFHGFPGTRLDWTLFDADDSATELNARIIAVDRPGTGLSDFKRDREILDWPDDVIELADALQLDRFAVVGISGGGPYTAACALKISGRLTATAIVCGMPPSEAPGIKEAIAWSMFAQSPEERRPMLTGMASLMRENPDQFVSGIVSGMKQSYPEGNPDRVVLDQPGFAKMFVDRTFGEALRLGIDGVDQDAALYALPWGFQLQDITAEVHLWHGEQDLNVPISAARYVADAIPNCHATFFKDEGHISITHNHIREILNVLVA